MTTFISEQPREEIEERTRQAWARYTERLRGLEGERYAAEEPRAWEQLQRELGELHESEQRDPAFG